MACPAQTQPIPTTPATPTAGVPGAKPGPVAGRRCLGAQVAQLDRRPHKGAIGVRPVSPTERLRLVFRPMPIPGGWLD